MNLSDFDIKDCPVGKKSVYSNTPAPQALFPIPRAWSRQQCLKGLKLPAFKGFDLWNDYEFFFENALTGKKQAYFLQIAVPCDSTFLIESKSLKLYLFSLNALKLEPDAMIQRIKTDIEEKTKSSVFVRLLNINDSYVVSSRPSLVGTSLDHHLISKKHLEPNADLLETIQGIEEKEYTFTTKLFRSTCVVTSHPDWANIQIKWTGAPIKEQNLFEYLVSFRGHQGIHEQCIEHIFIDINDRCKPSKLLVKGNFTRRGGLDINPVRYMGYDFEEKDWVFNQWSRCLVQ